MTAPTAAGTPLPNGDAPAAVAVETLRQRSDFVAASRARRASRPAFTLQARLRKPDEHPALMRIGFTCSRKVGNAVARNRAKRRLRALAHEVLRVKGHPGWDYVLVGRANETATRPFAALIDDLLGALRSIHAPRDDGAKAQPAARR